MTNYVAKLSTAVLKMPVKRLTQKEKESQEEKKANKREKKNKRGKRISQFDDEQNSADVSGESDDEEVDGRESLSQLSQSSQLFDEEELAEVRYYWCQAIAAMMT